jgi:hypothetical protein
MPGMKVIKLRVPDDLKNKKVWTPKDYEQCSREFGRKLGIEKQAVLTEGDYIKRKGRLFQRSGEFFYIYNKNGAASCYPEIICVWFIFTEFTVYQMRNGRHGIRGIKCLE